MKFSEADVICFDVDYTLIKFSNTDFIYLQYDCLAQLLVKYGAPSELLTMIPREQLQRLGSNCTIADFRTGCLIKLASDSTIIRAYHGTSICENLVELYGDPPVYCVQNVERQYLENERWIFLTHYSYGAALIWMACVELIKQGKFQIENYIKLGEMIHRIANLTYGSNTESQFYPEFYANPQKYVMKVSNEFKAKLFELKTKGKKLAIVTNGNGDYCNFIMNYAYGEDWHSIFDAYVFSAGKPEFFYHENELEIIEHLNLDGEVYIKGSSKNLKDKVGGHHYVFVGDHYQSDVHGAKQFDWMAVALVEEIYYEKSIREIVSYDVIENSPLAKPDDDILDYFDCWGSHFVDQGKKCFWWDFITCHADAIIPSIEKIFDLFEEHK